MSKFTVDAARLGAWGCRQLVRTLLALIVASCASPYPPVPAKAELPVRGYVIGPLDALTITVWRNPELSATVAVRPDGKISTPLIEDMPALGRTPSELGREIEKSLSKYVREPVVTVAISGFQGQYSDQIRVVGEALRPQSIGYRQSMTLLDVMIQCGGLTEFADGNRAVLVRGLERGKQYSVRLRDLIKRGDISANADVLPGDVLIIPQSFF
jgi:polysaccharide biosynthesis/export protein